MKGIIVSFAEKDGVMKIASIRIENFRNIQFLDIKCGSRYNVFAGENGAGKSTVINATKILLSWLVARIRNPKGRGISIADKDITKGTNYCMLQIELSDGTSWQLTKQKNSDRTKAQHYTLLQQMNVLANEIAEKADLQNTECQVPIFAVYGVNRAVNEIPLRLKKKHRLSPLDVYSQLDAESSFRTFFEWYREREDIDNANYRYEETFTPDIQLTTVKKAVESVLPNYHNLRVKRNPMSMTLNKDGVEFDIKELSDGEKCYISLVADIARLLAMANPGLKNPLDGNGVVLIDEIDLHLHPQWQSQVLSSIVKVFPNCQFFFTTHSPFVVSNIRKEASCKMFLMQDGKPSEVDDNLYGQKVSDILTNVFNVESLRNPETHSYLNSIWSSLSKGDFKSDQFKNSFDWLKKNLDNADIEFAHINLEKQRLMNESK